jgi:DNA gyrase/topoisomerase IV subunit B
MSEQRPGSPVEYNAASIQVVRGCQHIRFRPGMYLGSTDEQGLFNLLMVVVDYCLENSDLPTEMQATLLPGNGLSVGCRGLALPPRHLETLASEATSVAALCPAWACRSPTPCRVPS